MPPTPRTDSAGARSAGAELRQAVEDALAALRAIPEAQSGRPPAPGKWSPKEVIGHLIDSAANNHQRFVRAGLQPDLIFPGYDQEEWVRRQRYGDAPWPELLELWRLYNLHLARVMEALPDELRLRPTDRHNFHRIGFHKIPEGEPATLDHLLHDYVAHLRHHLGQIEPAASASASI